MKTIIYKTTGTYPPSEAAELLAQKTGLSKGRIKDAMNKGAVWAKRKGGMKRLRKATTPLSPQDAVELHYDATLLALTPPRPGLLSDQGSYSVWFKPAGLMAQGTMFGDHCSLLRLAELHFQMQRKVFLVHRIDREAEGLMLVAHTKEAAAKLSELFRTGAVVKGYRVVVAGDLGEQGRIALPLDGNDALTEYTVEHHDPERNTTTLSVFIKTGRLHQIRRHFDLIGHPVMGDPRYGKGNKNSEGMKLAAVSIGFICPFSRKTVQFRLERLQNKEESKEVL